MPIMESNFQRSSDEWSWYQIHIHLLGHGSEILNNMALTFHALYCCVSACLGCPVDGLITVDSPRAPEDDRDASYGG